MHPWFLSLKAYTTDYDDMLLCPTARRRPARIPGSSFNPWYYHWSPFDVIVGSYGYNAWLGESHYRVAGHAGIPVVFDCRSARAWPTHYDDPPEYEGQFGRPSPVLIYMRTVCLNRHSGGINMLFRDWSVRKVGLKENWTLKW
ncbi:MAG: hypothetical protein IIC50_00725, partial [Planctomycetes bacterium]|nr:hypothetical protein [Planctomycetota bacterium]